MKAHLEDLNDYRFDSEGDHQEEFGSAINRVKMEDIGDPEVLAKFKRQEQEEREEIEREIKAHKERIQREAVAAIQRQAHVAMGITSPTSLITSSATSLSSPPPAFPMFLPQLPSRLMTTTLPHSTSPGSSASQSIPSPSVNSNAASTSSQTPNQDLSKYSFEEQFGQKPVNGSCLKSRTDQEKNSEALGSSSLYELSDDPQRKEFLDDLFQFMQKRGTPVNRVPIMAKQVLDLYELYKLVVARGGLVEVINKKIWREITKGLNLPSSITSAAFTLRTQYMKYLYPYECEKKGLSTPEELQAAIDGNRREGRRSSYTQYAELVSGARNSHPQHLQPNPAHHTSPLDLVSRQVNGYGTGHGLSSGEEDNGNGIPTSARLTVPQQEALNLQMPRNSHHSVRPKESLTRKMEDVINSPPAKRFLSDDDLLWARATLPSAHFKITSRVDGRSQADNSLVVSMEINGVMYQGLLFAQSHKSPKM
ncbi:AT-rich interactive domain-containing protein 3C-like isoform X2 [Limulus polyphemus]|uniref:AT-rich interactive domain-containing protein 3C-like isoform X2 n=1 Tax=Limulus polyphemus TaxID=6850 RepID=A0ABM1S0U3_LIMPO|nr:AT-rich interactive domain-containing protein 3C-like isoform X2 [Limulus polyphemus]